jgi:hypothetical protein
VHTGPDREVFEVLRIVREGNTAIAHAMFMPAFEVLAGVSEQQ